MASKTSSSFLEAGQWAHAVLPVCPMDSLATIQDNRCSS